MAPRWRSCADRGGGGPGDAGGRADQYGRDRGLWGGVAAGPGRGPADGAVVPAGLAGTLALVQALGDAGVGAPLWVLTRGAVAARAQRGGGQPGAGDGVGAGSGGRAGAPGSVGRPGGRAAGPGTSGPRPGCARCWPGAARIRSRSATPGSGAAAGAGAVAGRREAMGAAGDGAGDRGHRGGRRARGPVGGSAGRAAGGAGQPVGSGRGRGGGPGGRAGRGRPDVAVVACDLAERGGGVSPAGLDQRGWPAAGRGAARRGPRSRDGWRQHDGGRAGRDAGGQGGGAALPGRADRGPGPGRVRAVLLGRRDLGPARGPGYAAANAFLDALAQAPPGPGAGRDIGGVGPVGRRRNGARGRRRRQLQRRGGWRRDGSGPGRRGAWPGAGWRDERWWRWRTWTGRGSRRRSRCGGQPADR